MVHLSRLTYIEDLPTCNGRCARANYASGEARDAIFKIAKLDYSDGAMRFWGREHVSQTGKSLLHDDATYQFMFQVI